MKFVRWLVILWSATALWCGGCHRGYYRRQADAEVKALIREKATDPRWDLPDTTIDIRPESRLYDPFSADHPPLPPDDPASAKLMQVVDDKPGYRHWHANGDTDYVENPEWMSYLPMDERGVVIIDNQRAMELALTHSTSYQRQREDLYLSALNVSFQRFGFDTQLFAGRSISASARRTPDPFPPSMPPPPRGSSNVSLSRDASLERTFATGANFVVSLANSITWNLWGPNTQSATSLIKFALTQPLLRGAGRDVILESLTQAERTLLTNIRSFERFRQNFFLQVTTGNSAGTGTGTPGGLLGLLRSQQSIRIQEFNVASLRNVLNQFIEFRKAERIDSLQLTQVETTLYNSERTLLDANTTYQNQLDQFKRTLGLPPDLPVEIRDPFLQQFELIDNDLNGRQFEINTLKAKVGDTLLDASSYLELNRKKIEVAQPEAAPQDAADPEKALEALRRQQELELSEEYGIDWNAELQQKIQAIAPLTDEILPLIKHVAEDDLNRVRADIEQLRQVRPRRAAALAKLRAAIQAGTTERIDIEPGILEESSLEDPDKLIEELGRLETKLQAGQASVEGLKNTITELINQGPTLAPRDLYLQIDERLLSAVPKQLTDVASLALELSLLQARARTDSIELAGVDLGSSEAIQIARCCRLDWMNARASLVDNWRRIEVVADQLESDLDLMFDGSLGGNNNNPFKILSETGQFSASLRFDSPITRLAERNAYRSQLITYQQARRTYYEFEDDTKRQLRLVLRNLELNKILFELARRSIKVSVQQVELARFRLEAPPQGVGGGGGTGGTSTAGRSQLGATTARDLTDALNGLLSAQNSFLNVWVTFEVLRRDLDFSLGTIQLDDRGFWIDPGTIDVSIAVACGANISAGTNATFPRTQDVTPPRSAVPVEIRIEPIAPSGTLPVNVPMNQSQWLPEMDVERPGYLPEGESPIGLNLVPRDEGALEESAVAADLFSMPSQLVPKLAPPQSQSPQISAAPENSPAPVSANDWLAAPEIIPTTPAASSPSPNSTRWQSQAKSGQ